MELDEQKTSGVDFTRYTPSEAYLEPGLLHYGKGELTDKYFIKYPVFITENREAVNTGEHDMFLYQYQQAHVGDYVTTCDLKGACFKCDNKDLAFGRILKIYGVEGDNDGACLLGRARVAFL